MGMPPRKNLREVDKAIISAVMFNSGIIPMELTTLDMRRVLAQLPPDEARVLKRKFRKLWRKAMRSEIGNGPTRTKREIAAKNRLGIGKVVPSRSEKNARKELVFKKMWHDIIEPHIRNFENSIVNDPAHVPK